jgi:hypothetical protein
MRASELLGLQVYDRDGEHLGAVHDVKVSREPTAAGAGILALEGLVVGPGSIGVRLGYGHGETRGPWLLAQIFRRRARRLHFVPWPTIARRTSDEVHLAVRASELPAQHAT